MWKSESQRHQLASRGVRTTSLDKVQKLKNQTKQKISEIKKIQKEYIQQELTKQLIFSYKKINGFDLNGNYDKWDILGSIYLNEPIHVPENVLCSEGNHIGGDWTKSELNAQKQNLRIVTRIRLHIFPKQSKNINQIIKELANDANRQYLIIQKNKITNWKQLK
jgi:hypothetical protein